MHEQYLAGFAEKHALSELQQVVFRDFYLSFQFTQAFSNENDHLNEDIYEYVVSQYTKEQLRAINADRDMLFSPVAALTLPSTHGKIPYDKAHVMFQFSEEWMLFTDTCQEIVDQDKPQPEQPVVTAILQGLIRKDIFRQTTPRARNSDPHESFVRTYGVLATPTGSPVYDGLFAKMRPRVLRAADVGERQPSPRSINGRILKLQTMWEHNHPEQTFFPPAQSA